MKKHVLVGADRSSAGRAAADWAALRAGNLGLNLQLVRVVPEQWAFREPAQHSNAMAGARTLLDAEADRLSSLIPLANIETIIRAGEIVQVLQELSDGAETVVVGTDRRPDFHGEGFGSISFQTVVLSRSTVVVIPDIGLADRHGVIVGVDGSPDSALALNLAAVEASRTMQDLTAIYSCPPADGQDARPGRGAEQEERRRLLSAVSPIRNAYPDLVVQEIFETNESPPQALIHAAANARLLVIGLRGRGGFRKPVGSIAWQVLLDVQCPTMVTRPL